MIGSWASLQATCVAFPRYQKELDLSDMQKQRLFPKLDALIPGRSNERHTRTEGVPRVLLTDIKLILLPRQFDA